jgi:hypothetical protein
LAAVSVRDTRPRHLRCRPGQAVSGVPAGRQRDHPQEGRHRLGACHIKDRNELKLLRWLYPEPNLNLSEFEDDWLDVYRDHPFADQLLAPDGNFYPRDSKLRPAGAADDLLVQTGNGPPIFPVIPCNAPCDRPRLCKNARNRKAIRMIFLRSAKIGHACEFCAPNSDLSKALFCRRNAPPSFHTAKTQSSQSNH